MNVDTVSVFLEDGHRRLAERLGEFARTEMTPFANAHSDAEARAMAREAVRSMGRQGWLQAHDCRTLCLFREAVAGVSPLADALFAIQGLATVPLRLEGSPAQRDRWLDFS